MDLSAESVATVVRLSGGYPYFVQFICRKVYDAFLHRIAGGTEPAIPIAEIEQKLDTDFFAGRWAKATDRQRDLLTVAAFLPGANEEFTAREIVLLSKTMLDRGFGASNANQMLSSLLNQGLVFKNRHGRYSFAVPLLDRYIRRQARQDPIDGISIPNEA